MAKTPKAHRNGTGLLVFGLLLTVIGGGMLVENIIGLHVWDYLWRLWPALLIVMGIKILLDHYLARNSSRKEEL